MKLVDRIYNEIAENVLEDAELPRLTLPRLAKHFGSSTRPVRQAVDRLVSDGLLQKLENGRLSRPEKISASKRKQVERRLVDVSDATDVHEAVKDHLIRLSLSGFSDYVREEQIAQEFDLSRAVLRRLFTEFSTCGLLHHVPRCGWKVVPFREDEMVQFIEVRRSLEDLALCEAFSRLDHEVINNMLDNNRRASTSKRPKEDNRLHEYIIAESGNRYIQNFFLQNSPYYDLFFDWESQNPASCRKASKEHCLILKSILSNNLQKARKALADHINYDHSMLLQFQTTDT